MFTDPALEPLRGVAIAPVPLEHIDSIVRRLKKVVQKSGLFQDYRRHECFIPKSERRRRESIAARKRQKK